MLTTIRSYINETEVRDILKQYSDRQRETERQRDRDRMTERQRETERDRERTISVFIKRSDLVIFSTLLAWFKLYL